MIKDVSVIGLGKLGASMAAVFAYRGFNVIGVDVNERAVELVNQGKEPVQETDLEKYISENKDRIKATMSHEEAVLSSDVSFVIVPTPSDENGSFSLQYASWAFKEIGKAIGKKEGYHNVVLTSTVLPGATRHGLIPILEKESGKKAGEGFGVCYSPEFIALGSIIQDFLHPDFTLLGEFDKKSGDQIEEIYSRVMMNDAPCKRMSLENAELTKISVNTFVTTKITFANMLADLCEKIPGGDIDVVSDALGTDKRIGRRYLTGAIGYGGPCFPRDNVALSYIAKKLGLRTELAETTDRCNRAMSEKIVEKIRPLIKTGDTVAVLGLAYKPMSHVVEESPGVYLADTLSKAGARVVAYDPLANESARAALTGNVVILESLKDCLDQATVVLITTTDDEFKRLKVEDLVKEGETVTVVDFWRILSNELKGNSSINYFAVGTSSDDLANQERLNDLWGAAATVSA
ncbi:MAG: UDP-glucose/GDP-mannose dehydrogenase family protein [Pyrinomonadaceae bacterium]|nr:UDP-glucose/GDP-mannose dehydrogenase family protein [Pyrinomonadaceae bacterium]